MAEDNEIENDDVINIMSLNCGQNPNLTDLDLNRISDDINYICNDLLFLEILREENNDVKELLDKHVHALKEQQPVNANDKKKIDDMLFEGEDAAFLKKRRDFAISLENLSEKLDSINTKKDSYAFFENITTGIVIMYILFYIWSGYKFSTSLTSKDFKIQSDAEKYNIGFVSNIAYIYMLTTLSTSFFQYNKLNATMGDLDTSICAGLSDIIASIKSIYQESGYYLEKLASGNNAAEDCKIKVLRQMYKVYYLKYTRNIFIAAKSEFKQTVNSINKFVSKQKKFLLKADNIDVEFTNDNAAFEECYNILLHNHGIKLFKGTKSPVEKRAEISKRYNNSNQYSQYENFLKDEFFAPYISFLSLLNPDKPNHDTSKLKDFLVTLDLINENSLPEYKECLELIFPIALNEYSDFTTDTYVNFVRKYLIDDPDAKILYNPNIDDYFKAVREYHIQGGNMVILDDESGMIDAVQTTAIMFTRIQQRKSNSSTIITKYRDFQKATRTRVLIPEDINDPKYFKEVFDTIRQHFIELTSEYKLNENIIMRFMTANLREDESFDNDPGKRSMVLSNIKFIVSNITVTMEISQQFRKNMLDGSGINMNKYISFLKFENKLQQLDQVDLEQLNKYVNKTNETIRTFRKYVKSEEILFSKRFQKMAIFDDMWQSTLIGGAILMVVQFTAMYGFSDRDVLNKAMAMASSAKTGAKTLAKGAKSTGKATASGLKNVASSTSSAYKSARSKFPKKPTASTTTSAPPPVTQGGIDPTWSEYKQGGDGEEMQGDKKALGVKKLDAEDEKPDWMTITVKVSSIIVLYGIFFTFVKSYLMKHKADLNYDKVINVLNTTKFEYEFSKLTRYFKEYTRSKSSKNCKKVYHSLIKVCEIYDKCNFIKNSMKRTPFPVTEMWVNGVVMAIFLGVMYVAFIGTGVQDYWKNKDRLDQLVKDIEKTFAVGKDEGAIPTKDDLENTKDYPDEKIKKMLETRDLSTDGDRDELVNRLDEALQPQRENQEEVLQRAIEKSKKERKKQKKTFTNYLENQEYQKASSELRNYISELPKSQNLKDSMKKNEEKLDEIDSELTADPKDDAAKTKLKELIDELFSSKALSNRIKEMNKKQVIEQSEVESNIQSGGESEPAQQINNNAAMMNPMMGMNPMGMGMGMGMMNMQMNSDAVMQKEMLKDYMNRYQNINAQLISMERESGYLNIVLAASILLFGTYFCTKIMGNTDRYQSLLTSGGSFIKDCL